MTEIENIDTKKRRLPGWLKYILIGLGVVVMLITAAGIGSYIWYESQLEAVSESNTTIRVEIAEGKSVNQIGRLLEEKKLIKNASVFVWRMNQLEWSGMLQAGTYDIAGNLSVDEIGEILVEGKVATQKITILPGATLMNIEKTLLDEGYSPGEVQTALSADYDHSLLIHKPANATLEGYIFPETYLMPVDATAEQLITHTFDVMQSRIDSSIENGVASQELNLHEAITLASIIQKESSDRVVQAQIAQVFLARLQRGMVLGADPTFRYAAELTGEPETPDLDHPYNTRIYGGLPPGPIGNFNISALEAVARPADGEFLYFVSGDNGKTYFSETFAEHQQKAAKYCIELCKL